MFPFFAKIPVNSSVIAGQTATLECAATGFPPPQISWQKDGGNDFPAAQERRMKVMAKDDAFLIVDVKLVDMGVYSCTAKNIAGMISTNATLTVLGIKYCIQTLKCVFSYIIIFFRTPLVWKYYDQ